MTESEAKALKAFMGEFCLSKIIDVVEFGKYSSDECSKFDVATNELYYALKRIL